MDTKDIEAEVSRLFGEGKLQEAATLLIESHGPNVLGFLASMLRDRIEATDAFAQVCENLWRGLPGFRCQSSFKTWFYTLARNVALNLRRGPYRRRHLPLSEVTEAVARVRTSTALHLRTDVKDGIAAIRAELSESDRMLLVLRIDRNMAWAEVAEVMTGGRCSDAERARVAARLRQRFQTLKEMIRKRAHDIGLLGDNMRRNV